jgi:hypothetical protein
MNDPVYIVQLHAQTPKNGDPKITVRVQQKVAKTRAEAEAKALSVAESRSLYDMGWVVTSCVGPVTDRGDFKGVGPKRAGNG